MKRRLQLAITLLCAAFAAATLLVLPFLPDTPRFGIVQIWLIAAILVSLFSIVGALIITILFAFPHEEFLSFLQNSAKKGELPSALPFKAPQELQTMYAVIKDITAGMSRQAGGMRKAADYRDIRYRLFTTMTHRLRTPVTGMKWALGELARRGAVREERDKALLNAAADSAKRISDIIEDLLKMAEVETEYSAIKRETIEIVPLLEDIIHEAALLAQSKRCTVTVERTGDAIPAIQGDKEQLHLALQNIISNAIQYSHKESSVHVRVERDEHAVVVKVIDRGVGIPAKEQATLFERFARGEHSFVLHTEGTGIGLYLAKGIITNHGGDVSVESEVSKGTTVTVTLPIRGAGELETFVEH